MKFKSFFDIGTGPLLSLLSTDDEKDLHEKSQANFDAAKKLSDFVGILIRLGFTKAAYAYLLVKAQNTPGFLSFVFGLCSISALILSIVISFRIFIIIFHYELREFYTVKRRIHKVFMAVFAMMNASMIWYCIGVIINEFAPHITP